MKLRAFAATIAVIVGLVTFSATTSSANSDRSVRASSEEVQAYAAGRYIVTTRRNVTPAALLNGHPGVRSKARTFRSAIRGFVADLTAEEANSLVNDPQVLSVEPDQIIRVEASQSRDTLLVPGNVWGVDRTDQRSLPLVESFTASTNGADVYIYVVDTPIRTSHTQFFTGASSRVLSGFPDGYSLATGCDGHGTHVAGTALGSDVGVAPVAKLVPVPVLNCSGTGYSSDVISGLEWILDDVVDNNRRPAVVNLSLGGGVFAGLDNAVNNLIAANITVVVAAGNATQDACNVSPARTPLAITVAASTVTDREATFSNYGNCVDIFAPGVDTLSAWSTGDDAGAFLDGTSMAAPHVAGVIALYLEANPSATPEQVWNWLRVNSTGCVITYPTARALRSPNRLLYSGNALGRPCPPSSVAASVGDSTSNVSWSIPEGFSGSEVLIYSVTTVPASAGCVTTGFSCSITGLINGQRYSVSVVASNSSFTSATAATTTVTPEGVPIAPTISGFTIGNASATVSWGSVPSTSTVTYTATAQPGGQSCSTTQLTCTIPGLTNGATYTFTVVAANISGAGAASVAAVAATYTTPPASVASRIRTKSKQITLTWNALEVPYAPSYTVRVAGTNKSCVTTTTSCTVTKLTNGKRYRLTVTATNIAGDGLPSQRTPYVVPGINVLRNTISKKKKILLSKFMTTLSAGRKTYKVTKGACRISSGYLVAPSRAGSCTLQLSVSASGAYPSMYNTANIKVT